MSDTPVSSDQCDTPNTNLHVTVRVDAMGESHHVVPADFARDQERRITEMEAAVQEIAELISGHDGHVFDDIAKVLLGTKP